MNARELEHLFTEWAHVTESEGRAISGRDWEEVQQQQRQKEELMSRMVRCMEAWQSIWKSTGETRADYDRRFGPTVEKLITLERNNAQLLAHLRDQVRQELAECDRTAENLRVLNRVYGSASGSHWSSYS